MLMMLLGGFVEASLWNWPVSSRVRELQRAPDSYVSSSSV